MLGESDVDEVQRLAQRFLAGRAPLLEARIRGGRVVDGHGDLLTEDIFCLPDGPRILDCLWAARHGPSRPYMLPD